MFEIIAPTVEEVGRSGNGRITVKIKGYWSHDPITVYVRRNYVYQGEPKWELSLSHSSGGRDNKEVSDDMEAGINFANAMLALVNFSREFFNENVSKFEEYYQQELDDHRKMREESKRLAQEKIDNDTIIGVDGAAQVVNKMIQQFNNDSYSREVSMVVRARGKNDSFHHVTFKNNGKATFKLNGRRFPKEEIIKKIAEYAEVI